MKIPLIREAQEKDLGSLIKLLDQLGSKPCGKVNDQLRRIHRSVSDDPLTYRNVCEISGNIVGTGLLIIKPNLMHEGRPAGLIEDVVVDKRQRGAHYGKEIIKDLVKKARASNCYKVTLDCSEKNVGFYEACEFKKSGEVQMRIDLD